MKTLSLALFAASLVAGPALAQSATPAATPAAATAPTPTLAAPNKTEQSKSWTIGQKVPNAFTSTSRFLVSNHEELGLPKAAYGSRWLVVGDNAYLVRQNNDIIVKIVGVTPKG